MNTQRGFIFPVVVFVVGALLTTHGTAQSTNIQHAYKAMEMARSYKVQGELAKAENMFRIALHSAPEQSNVHREAQDELDYYLPLVRIQRLLWDGKVQTAERELFALQQTVEDQPVRRQEINRIMRGLQSTAATDTQRPGDATVDEKFVMREIRTALDSYYRQNNRYPASRSSLLDVLALDRPPLDSFEIERYSSNGAGYLLILRSKGTSQTITLQHTGLLQKSGSP